MNKLIVLFLAWLVLAPVPSIPAIAPVTPVGSVTPVPSTEVDGKILGGRAGSIQYPLPLTLVNGEAQGTTYSVKYYNEKQRNFKPQFDSILAEFDRSLSIYNPHSEVSKFNQGKDFSFKLPYLLPILRKSLEVYQATNGAFDPTVMPLVEAYGFGSKKVKNPELVPVNSLLRLVGFDKIKFDNLRVQKTNPAVRLDFNGIAQGYSVDLLSRFLESKNIRDYTVEIGGEVFCSGVKSDGTGWRAGIEDPLHPGALIATVTLKNLAMTTAGNYRNHFTRNGQVFNHIINPKTGSMEQSSLLSVTVFAKDAITADGFDTAFFVMGTEATKEFLAKQTDLQAYLIYTNAAGEIETFTTPGIKDFIKEKFTQ